MKILVISDIHLNYDLFSRAAEIVKKEKIDQVVQMGDLFDNWFAPDILYRETLEAAQKFKKAYPNTVFLLGNHELHYLAKDSLAGGYKASAKPLVQSYIEEFQPKVFYELDNIIFSHAGVLKSFYRDYDLSNEEDLSTLNEDNSPLWLRPARIVKDDLYSKFQVVGHTPVYYNQYDPNFDMLFTDTHSKYKTGRAIGNGKFVIIDTETLERTELR